MYGDQSQYNELKITITADGSVALEVYIFHFTSCGSIGVPIVVPSYSNPLDHAIDGTQPSITLAKSGFSMTDSNWAITDYVFGNGATDFDYSQDATNLVV